MAKLERLRQLAKRKTMFDDRGVEIEELTYVIKQDLAGLTQALGQLRESSRKEHPKAWVKGPHTAVDQEGEHGKNVVVMLSGRLESMTDGLQGVLQTRMNNMLSSRARTEKFVSNVSQYSQNLLDPSRSDSPLYNNNSTANRTAQQDTLSLEPGSSSETQLLLMEEGAQANNPYIQQRGQAIEMIEKTMNELGGMFTQLAQMVSEQGEQIDRIDQDVEDISENVEGMYPFLSIPVSSLRRTPRTDTSQVLKESCCGIGTGYQGIVCSLVSLHLHISGPG
jgi:syntaxin 5